jgi:alpha-L-fucosidase 2
MEPFLGTVGSDRMFELARQRAAASWQEKGAEGGPGQTVQSMACGPMPHPYYDPGLCPPSVAGGYAGLELTTHVGPFAGLSYYSDLSLRSVGGMVAMSLIDYYEYTRDTAFLAATAYPFLDGVADFYLSYVTLGTDGTFSVLNACAQEICGPGGAPEDNPHTDLAFARAVLAALLRYSEVLDVDAAKRPLWANLLANLAPYPTTTYGGATVFAEAGTTGGSFPDNAGYPIVYFAAMHPANVLTRSSATPEQLQTAINTVLAVNAANGWAPGNGLCLAWPAATRVLPAANASWLLDNFESALARVMYPNLYPSTGGGGVEESGASEAINSLLLQGHEGFLRLFPLWPLGETAAFTTLRAVGAFLVSAAIDATGVVANVTITSTVGGNCSVLSPWIGAGGPVPLVVTTLPGGGIVPTVPAAWPGVYTFATAQQQSYGVAPAAGGV